jgi:hypothetical protein
MQILSTDEIVFDLIENLIDLTLPHYFHETNLKIHQGFQDYQRKIFDFIKCNMLFIKKFLDVIRAVES